MLILRILQGILIVGALLPVLTGCSSKPVYEKMSVNYVVHLDMRGGQNGSAKYKQGAVRDENMDLIDGMLNKELRSQLQFDEIPNE